MSEPETAPRVVPLTRPNHHRVWLVTTAGDGDVRVWACDERAAREFVVRALGALVLQVTAA